MNYAAVIVDRLGGARALAAAMDLPVATVRSWAERGSIHDKHKPAVMAVARGLGVVLTPADFFPGGGVDDLAGAA